MEPSAHVLRLPPSYFILPVLGLFLVWGLSFLVLRSSVLRKNESRSQREKDWSIPPIDSQSGLISPFHRWDPRIKLVSLLFFMFCTASLTQLSWACLALLISLVSLCMARIPFRHPMRRLGAMGGFLGMFLVVMPLTAPVRTGDTVIVFEHLSFLSLNLRGLLLALLICVKASAIALMVEPLLATAPFSTTMKAVAGLKVPPVVCQMLLLAHRYIHVFQDEARRMVKGMGARGFEKRTDMETLRTIGNFLGMLLVRSFERTQRVYDAMLARGYNGTLPGDVQFYACGIDWQKGVFWVMAGLLLLAGDRFLKIADLVAWQ